MEARIANFRSGRHTQHTDQYILVSESVKDKDAANRLIGKKVAWRTPTGNTITGKISKPHGNGGAMLAKFDKGLPGQALGTTVQIEE